MLVNSTHIGYCVTSKYLCCEFESRLVEVSSIQHYVIMFVSDLLQVGGFLRIFGFPPTIKNIHDITEILLKVSLNTITIILPPPPPPPQVVKYDAWLKVSHIWVGTWTIKEISIFSNSSHFEWRVGLSDTILKWDYPRTIPAKFALIWFSGFRGEDLNVIFYQNMPNLHNR